MYHRLFTTIMFRFRGPTVKHLWPKCFIHPFIRLPWFISDTYFETANTFSASACALMTLTFFCYCCFLIVWLCFPSAVSDLNRCCDKCQRIDQAEQKTVFLSLNKKNTVTKMFWWRQYFNMHFPFVLNIRNKNDCIPENSELISIYR